LKDDNGNGQVDREKLKKAIEGEQKLDITAEIIKLYQHDPISHQVIQYLLSKYKIIPLNAIENIRQHREEILLNIVKAYKMMWNARGKIMLKAMQSGDKPVKIVIKERGTDEGNKPKEQTKSSRKDGANEGPIIKKESGGDINKKSSDGI